MSGHALVGSWCVFFLHLTSIVAPAQSTPAHSVRDVDVCAVLKDPGSFDAQSIRLRGRLSLEFEGDVVDDSSCTLPLLHTGIWWHYGGDPMLPSEARRTRGLVTPVLRDTAFEEFRARTSARRVRRPDGDSCGTYRECSFYDVTATFTGWFFAGKMHPGPGGFGHMGCCDLFVVEQVSDVAATRTKVPNEDEKFSCSNTTWQSEYQAVRIANLAENAAANKQFLIEQMRGHGDASLIDAMEPSPSWHYLQLTGWLMWSSPDLLITYKVEFPNLHAVKKPKKHHPASLSGPITVNVTRERCEPMAPEAAPRRDHPESIRPKTE